MNFFHLPDRRRSLLLAMINCLIFVAVHSQDKNFESKRINGGTLFHFTSTHTCFPDARRSNGYVYDNRSYDFNNHYSDSSVLIVVPENLRVLHDSVDLVFWFHGWHNNIDTALNYYHLAEQFIAAHKNAILVLAESAKDAPDSYGGKLEQQDVFKYLVQDVLKNLKANRIISASCNAGNIVLSGHSGAYRVIAYISQNGGMSIKEIISFDALYGETDKFMLWLKKEKHSRFINMYTNTGGGTDEVSIKMMDSLRAEKIAFSFSEENNVTDTLLSKEKINFIHSTRQHNDIIFSPDNFLLFLKSSPFLQAANN